MSERSQGATGIIYYLNMISWYKLYKDGKGLNPWGFLINIR
jgi:hypothetical protein